MWVGARGGGEGEEGSVRVGGREGVCACVYVCGCVYAWWSGLWSGSCKYSMPHVQYNICQT